MTEQISPTRSSSSPVWPPQDARAAQFAYMLEGMRQQGHDDVTTRDFLARDLDLPLSGRGQSR